MKLFVAGIGTDVGKTVVSAILVEALSGEYWKPIQTGAALGSDRELIQKLVNPATKVHPESIVLTEPLSPHEAARRDGVDLELDRFKIPTHSSTLIIEGAGGVLVPLNATHCVIDLINYFKADVVLVSKHYLGSINHTLLTIEALKSRQIPLRGIIYNGEDSFGAESIVESFTHIPVIGRISTEEKIDRETVCRYAERFRGVL